MITRRSFLQRASAVTVLSKFSQGAGYIPVPETALQSDELWYRQAARRWLEALPLGNGRLGAMVYGGVETERIALSEATAWSGQPEEGEINPAALRHLAAIRQMLFDGQYVEANQMVASFLMPRPKNFGTNLPLPELLLQFKKTESAPEYRRSLSLERAVANVRFQTPQGEVQRTAIASHVDKVFAYELRCNHPGAVTFRLGFGASSLPVMVAPQVSGAAGPGKAHTGAATLRLRGRAVETKHSDGHAGVGFEIWARIVASGGHVTFSQDALNVTGASSVVILVAIATTFDSADPSIRCKEILDEASARTFAELMQRHLRDYQPLYRRVAINLGGDPEKENLPTDLRRKALERGTSDPGLLALFFQYGRYLTIAGSRADSPLPLALQGIWNDGLASSMGWTDDFHLDINTQQNYWPAEVCNLSECQLPLVGLLERLRRRGHDTARQMYGAPGWVAHTVTNPWGYTAPGRGQGWGFFVTAGVWISLQLWEHFRFTGDRDFLKRVYPIFTEASDFFLSYMAAEPSHGWLVTGPSDSPENAYRTPDGKRATESMGVTVDRVLVDSLLGICLDASAALGVDADRRPVWSAARSRLPPLQVGKHGQLQEWLIDFEDANPNHRHTSHLIALYPEHQISPRKTTALAHAAAITMERRVSAPNWEQTEWGRANFSAFYARLLQGDMALKYLVELMAKAADDNLLTYSGAGVAGAEQNIFALDGNTAGAAALAEMLLQSQGAEVELLPALPTTWPNGWVRGLRARGGFTVDIAWKGGTLYTATLSSPKDAALKLRYGSHILSAALRGGRPHIFRNTDFTSSKELA